MAAPWERDWSNATIVGGVEPVGNTGKKIGSTDAKEQVETRARQRDARATMYATERAFDIANRYPGGLPSARIDELKRQFGSNHPEVQDYEMLKVLANRAAISKAGMLKPASNTDIELLRASGMNPSLMRANNRQIADIDYADAARTYYETALQQQWISRYGSLNAPRSDGKTFTEVLSKGLQGPTMRKVLQPLSQRKDAFARSKQGQQNRVIDFNDYQD